MNEHLQEVDLKPCHPDEEEAHKRAKTLIFRVSQPEYDHYSAEAKKRHMAKAELFRYLLARYFVDDKKK